MSEPNSKPPERRALPVSEDWLAVLLGFGLVALVYLGVFTQVPW